LALNARISKQDAMLAEIVKIKKSLGDNLANNRKLRKNDAYPLG